MTRFNRKLFGLVVTAMVILCIGYFSYPGEENGGSAAVTLIIDFRSHGELHRHNLTIWRNGKMLDSQASPDNTTRFEFHGLGGENLTVFDVLREAAAWGNFTIRHSTHKTQAGIFLDSLAGVENSDNSWQYYVNDEYGITAADRKPVHDGDVIRWVYE